MRRVTQRLLERNSFRVVTAKDGLEAIGVLQDHRPDIILLDVEMPRMDGYEFAKHVRNNPGTAHVPIVMITSRVSDKHRARAIEVGVNDYLGKPYQERQLLEAVRHQLKTGRLTGTDTMQTATESRHRRDLLPADPAAPAAPDRAAHLRRRGHPLRGAGEAPDGARLVPRPRPVDHAEGAGALLRGAVRPRCRRARWAHPHRDLQRRVRQARYRLLRRADGRLPPARPRESRGHEA